MASEWTIFTYDLGMRKNKDMVRLVQSLKGRSGGEGVVAEHNGRFLAPACFMVPRKSERQVRAFLSLWKIKYVGRRVVLMATFGVR